MIKKYRIVQDNVILHDGLDEDEAKETLNILYAGMSSAITIEEYEIPTVTGLGRDPDLH
jgi:hypothetical protein